jgi:phage terminase Nu1 subunit (DNA packaging protein)
MPDEQQERQENLYSVETIARLLLLDVRRVQQLSKQGVIPKEHRNQYSLVGSVQGYIRYLKNEKGGGNLADEFNQAKTRDMNAKAHLNEMKLRRQRGELIAASEVRHTWQTITELFRDRLLTMPDRLAPRIMGAKNRQDAKALIQEEIRQTLETLSRTEIENAPACD